MRTGRASSRENSINLRIRQTDTAQNSTEQNNLRHQDRRKLTGEQRTGITVNVRLGMSPRWPTAHSHCKSRAPLRNRTLLREVWQGGYFPTVIKMEKLGETFFTAADKFYFKCLSGMHREKKSMFS